MFALQRLGRRLRPGLAAVLLATAAVTACGGDSGGPVAAQPDRTLPPLASTGTSPSSTSSSTSSPTSSPTATAATGRGQKVPPGEFAAILRRSLDRATTAYVTMQLGDGAPDVEGEADYTTTPPSLEMTMTSPGLGTQVEVRMVGGSVYAKAPTSGPKWVLLSSTELGGALGADLEGQLDPTETFAGIADAVRRASYHGTEDVDGQSLEHYTSVVSTQRLLESAGSDLAGTAGLPDTMTQEWWFDAEGRIGRYSNELALGGDLVITFSDWGRDVRIEAPPPGQVTSTPR